MLAQGNVLNTFALRWDGELPIDENMELTIIAQGYTDDVFRCSFTTVNPEVGRTGIVRDP